MFIIIFYLLGLGLGLGFVGRKFVWGKEKNIVWEMKGKMGNTRKDGMGDRMEVCLVVGSGCTCIHQECLCH
jgi:hypothetical protein